MSRKPIPKYRKQVHKAGDRAFVELCGIRHYLGKFNSPESREKYARLLGEWEANGRLLSAQPTEITITELSARFLLHCQEYYKGSRETYTIKTALCAIESLYGDAAAIKFGPLALRAVGQSLIEKKHSRDYINRVFSKIKMMFRWAVSEELIPAAAYDALRCVSGLKYGRTSAHECEPVVPVADEVVDHTLQYMTPTLQTMVRLQRLCGARPGEIVQMRTCDLDMSADVWTFKPQKHKTMHRGINRTIYLGPRSQEFITPLLKRNLQEYIFSPIQSERERLEVLHANRKTPMSCGNVPGSATKRNPIRKPTDRYDTSAYGRAIAYACKKAYPAPKNLNSDQIKAWDKDHRWSPNQLRHSFASEVRRDHGLEASQILLGHAKADTTQIYAQRDERKALDVARLIG